MHHHEGSGIDPNPRSRGIMGTRMSSRLSLSALAFLTTFAACSKNSATPPVADAQTVDDGSSRDAPKGSASASTTASGPAPLGALPPLPTATGSGRFAIPGRTEDAIEVVLPEKRAAKPALLIAFHATGEDAPNVVEAFDLVARAEGLGFVAIAPRAGYRDAPHPPDVDHPANWGGSSWNMWTPGVEKNEDLRYVRALIEAAKKSWNIDPARVYTAGFSNGAFFSYFVAASMPDRVSGFAANSGGWTTEACPQRTDHDGSSLYPIAAAANAPASKDLTCANVFADPKVPKKCRPTAANKLRPPATSGRTPFGYLAHYIGDDAVSPVWSCLLAESLGGRAKAKIRTREADGTAGHAVMPGFIDDAFKFFAGRTTAQ